MNRQIHSRTLYSVIAALNEKYMGENDTYRNQCIEYCIGRLISVFHDRSKFTNSYKRNLDGDTLREILSELNKLVEEFWGGYSSGECSHNYFIETGILYAELESEFFPMRNKNAQT